MLSNITTLKRCFDSYIGTIGLPVQYEGVPFDDKIYNTWITPTIIDNADEKPYRDNEVKQSANILYQIDIYTKKSASTSADFHYNIRDTVDSKFKIGQDITYSVSGTVLARARVRELVDDFSFNKDPLFHRYVLSYEIDYNEC